MSQGTLSSEEYDQFWGEWGDFNRYHPGSRHRRRIIFNFLKDIKFHSLLDVGCGNGELLRLVKQQFPFIKNLAGADFSAKVIDDNRLNIKSADFFVLDLENGSLQKKFDLVICSEVVEHLNNREAAIRNLSAMVNDGGYLLLTCPTGKLYPTEKYFGHVSHPSILEIQKLAEIGDLEIIRFENWGWPFYRLLKMLTNLNPDMAIRKFAKKKYGWPQRLISRIFYYMNFLNYPTKNSGCQFFILLRRRI
jgi:SAM-dependent methyltransferase